MPDETTFIQKAIAPAAQRQLSIMEKWGYNLLNAGIIGGATSVTSSGGLAIAHGAGVADIVGEAGLAEVAIWELSAFIFALYSLSRNYNFCCNV